MSYEPIHHKYRPQTFKELVGQETIALTLINALKQEKIAPAYLFTGPRGTGKTSSARILAKSLNCLNSDRPTPEPCGKCEVCLAIAQGSALDVMEIDAASNTGVDNIREIIERSRFAPVQCRYKIYVIDECHMLSTAAFNALLKTLEEPPSQVVFILATTDPQRVLSTIISRCQRFDYRRIPLKEMVEHLKYIAEGENIAIADEALTLIAQIANGGLRDAESLLDQLSLLPDTISVAKVWDLVGAVPEQDLLGLLQAIHSHNSLGILEQCRSLLDRGREPIVVLQNLASFYLNLLIAKTAPQHPEMVAVTETCWQQLCDQAVNWQTKDILRGQQHLKAAETQLKQTTQPRLWLEVTLLGLLPQAHQIAVDSATQSGFPINSTSITETSRKTTAVAAKSELPQDQIESKITPIPTPPAAAPQTKPPVPIEKTSDDQLSAVAPKPQSVQQPLVQEAVTSTPSTATINNFDLNGIWNQVINAIQSRMTQALLKQQCHLVSFDGSSAIVGISSAKLQKLNQGKIPNIEQAFAQVLQKKVKVQLEVAQKTNQEQNSTSLKFSVSPPPPTHQGSKAEQTPNSTAVISSPSSIQQPQAPQVNSIREEGVTSTTSLKPSSPIQTTPEIFPASASHRHPILEKKDTPLPSNHGGEISSDDALNLPQTSSEIEHGNQDLQQAIANLTQSFEGELVEIDDENSLIPAASSSETNASSNLDRPDLEEYDDDW